MQNTGLVYQNTFGVERFLDGPEASPKEAVHVVLASEKVRDEYILPAPDVDEC
jgi:hypothetical protein